MIDLAGWWMIRYMDPCIIAKVMPTFLSPRRTGISERRDHHRPQSHRWRMAFRGREAFDSNSPAHTGEIIGRFPLSSR